MSTRKLLLADDSVTIQKVVNLTFADEGIEVITVGDGNSAMEKMAEVSPDLVMADVNMPGLNGYEVCERIKQDSQSSQTPVILLVGSFEPFDEAEARRVGADDFLTKPFQSIRQLVSKVTVLLDSNDSKAANIYAATANNSFADTLDMDKEATVSEPESESLSDTDSEAVSESESENDDKASNGNAGMDDEMIEAYPASSFAFDETSKFETKEVSEADDSGYGKTQPLSSQDLQDINFEEYSNSGRPSDLSKFNIAEAESAFSASSSSPSSSINFDDDDFLEIPFDEDEEEETAEPEEAQATAPDRQPEPGQAATNEDAQATTEPETESRDDAETRQELSEETADVTSEPNYSELVTVDNQDTEPDDEAPESHVQETAETLADENTEDENPETNDYTQDEIVIGQIAEPEQDAAFQTPAVSETATSPEIPAQFSPELIDAIAQRVIEKLSDKVVREIAWEVVPQQADLIIRKMVEEKLRE